MTVTRVDAIEPVKDFLKIVLLDSDTVIGNRYHEFTGLVPCTNLEMQCYIGSLVFDGIVHKIEDDIGEMHLIDHAERIFCFKDGIDSTTYVLNLELESVDYAVDELIDIQFLTSVTLR